MSALREAIAAMPAVDSHAHVGLWDDRASGQLLNHDDLRMLFPRATLTSVLAPAEQLALDGSADAERPHRALLESWARGRESCYYEHVQDQAYAALWGDGDLATAVDAQRTRPLLDVYLECIERANLETVMVNLPDWPSGYERHSRLRWVPYLDQFTYAGDNTAEKAQGSLHCGTIGWYESSLAETLSAHGATLDELDLDGLLELADASIAAWTSSGITCFKFNCGYVRSLVFDSVSIEDARAIWNTDPGARTPANRKRLQDHIARFLLRRVADAGVAVQVHAAVGDTPGLLWQNARPTNLEQVFADPDLGRPMVVLLHGGYPACSLAGWYASAYANVYLDFSWLPILSEVVLRRSLDEWLDVVPHTKILFGTDAWSPELFYAGANSARTTLSDVLDRRVHDGLYSAGDAERVAQAIMRTNSRSVYQL